MMAWAGEIHAPQAGGDSGNALKAVRTSMFSSWEYEESFSLHLARDDVRALGFYVCVRLMGDSKVDVLCSGDGKHRNLRQPPI